MRFPVLSLYLIFFCTSTALASDLPNIVVRTGDNTIPLTIINGSNQPISELTIMADQEKLPAWLKISQTSVLILSATETMYEIRFPLTIIDALDGASTTLFLLLIDDQGRSWQVRVGLHVDSDSPIEDILLPNVPNPFNPMTTIRYQLAGEKLRPTTLTIYNLLGQQVRILVDELKTSGRHEVQWDGKDDKGREVANGVYIYQLISGAFIQTHKMLLLK